jgi:hypothetical protein
MLLIADYEGGGGTFGFVLEATQKAAPRIPLQVAGVIVNTSQTQILKAFLRIIAANSLQWAHESWGGWNQVNYDGQGNTIFLYVNPALNTSAAAASVKPVTDWAAGLGNLTSLNVVLQVASYQEFFNDFLAGAVEVSICDSWLNSN